MLSTEGNLKEVDINGKSLKCLVCGHREFAERQFLLNTVGMSLLNLDWANKTAICLICDSCGYIHWFMSE